MEKLDTTFQYYSGNINDASPKRFVSLSTLIEKIRLPQQQTRDLLQRIEQARKEGNEVLKRELKQHLPAFTPCAVVKDWRCYKNIQSFTGLLVLDFDKVENAADLKHHVFDSYEWIIAAWLSPSGNGFKAVCSIPIVQDVDDFKRYFRGIQKAVEDEGIPGLDPVGQNPVQLLFFGSDADILRRSNFATFREPLSKPTAKPADKPVFVATGATRQGKAIQTWYNNAISRIYDNGHPQVVRHSSLLGGFVASGYLSRYEAETIASEAISHNVYLRKDPKCYIKTAIQQIEWGMSRPAVWK
ncbi:MAG: BT4734/BF3469 family protein [Mangrovibacterium sp.]